MFDCQAVVEHENLRKAVITGLCDVADALPRVEISIYLYPTDAMQQAVSILYAHIIKFLVRAFNWCEEGKIAHAIRSIIKPAALHYDDLLEDIRGSTRKIADLATTNSQVEQRDINLELQALTALVKQMREDILRDQSIKGSMLLEHRHALSEIQLTQTLVHISSACIVDHGASLQATLLLRDKHRLRAIRSRCPPFWLSSELHAWNDSRTSSSITIRASFKNRPYIRDFCTNVIQQLRNAGVAVLWVLKSRNQICYSIIEILKSLINQALTLDPTPCLNSKPSFQLRQFLDAQSADDYVNLLGSCLEHFRLVHILVEAEAMQSIESFSCHEYLDKLSRKLSEHHAATILKIMMLRHGPEVGTSQIQGGVLLKVQRGSRRKGVRMPYEPLQNLDNNRIQQTHRNPKTSRNARGRS